MTLLILLVAFLPIVLIGGVVFALLCVPIVSLWKGVKGEIEYQRYIRSKK